nr:autotransporter-associated beta strand repeat-containing protein [Bacteroidaceae bacterium]
ESYCNIQNNLFINGPVGGGNAFTGGNTNFHCYVTGNFQDANTDGTFNPSAVTNFSGADVKTTPYNYPELETWDAPDLIENLLPCVGASLPYRDYVDYYMIDEVKTFGTEGALISNEGSLIYGAPNTWTVWKGNTRVDTDKDGMPDDWETANGLDPMVNDAMKIADNGYANIENYINSITADDRDFYLRSPLCVEQFSATTTTMQVKWRDYTYGEQGFIVMGKTADGEYMELARTESDVNVVTLKNLTPGTSYTIKICAFKDDAQSEYSDEVTLKTRPEEVGIVDIDTYVADVTWTKDVANWDKVNTGWLSSDGLYADDRKVLFNTDEEATITLDESVSPATVVFNNTGSIAISGNGKICGETSVNKAGKGTVSITTTNDYTGATVVHDGVLSFNSLKNGGEASAIGASEEFAQNWIFDGGTYQYTGGSTTTNRCAKLLQDGELNISNSSAVIKMNGTFEGDGGLIIDGAGQLNVNTLKFFGYTGATTLEGGTLYFPTAEISGNGIGSSSKLVFAGGKLQTKGENEAYETYSFPVEVREGTTSQFSPHRNCYIKNKMSGNGTLQINIPYVREYIQGNWDEFTGRLIANAASSGNLFLMSGKNIPNAVVVLKNGARACGWDTNGNYTLGGLSGDAGTYLSGSSKATNNFKCSWTIGGANTDETFKRSINNWSCSGKGHVGTTTIIKEGTGIWRLTGSNDYKGTTTVNGGRLVINGTNSGTGLITVNSDATLAGTGSVAGAVSVKSGGEIYAGDTTLVNRNTLTIKGKLTVASGATVTIPVSINGTTTKANRLVLTGGATFSKPTLNLEFENIYTTLDIPEGTEFKIFSPSGTVSGSFGEILPATPGEGKVWDSSDLLTKGILRVIVDPALGINNVSESTNDEEKTFDMSGRTISPARHSLIIKGGKKMFMNK